MAENNSVPQVEDEAEAGGDLGSLVAQKADKAKYLVLAVLVVLIAIAALVGYMRKSAAQSAAAAKDKVFETVAKIQNENTPGAQAAQLFADAARDYSGLDAGAQAAMMQFAYAYNENKDYAAAEKVAADFVKTYPRSPMLGRARLALGQAMLQQDKVDDAIAAFRTLVAANDPETFPEAKLALAQALERRAAQAEDDPAEYRSRLEAAEAEFTDIITRSQIPTPSQRGFWPQAVTLPADYALVQLKDKLAGHTHGTPVGAPAEGAVAVPEAGVMSIPPPPAESAEADDIFAPVDAPAAVADAVSAAAESVETGAEAAVEAAAEAASDAADTAGEAAAEAASDAKAAAAAAAEAASEAVEQAGSAASEAVAADSSAKAADPE